MDVWWLRPLFRTVIVIPENNSWCLLLDTENVDVSLILHIFTGLKMEDVIKSILKDLAQKVPKTMMIVL